MKSPRDKGFLTPVHFLDIRRDLSTVDALAAPLTYDEVGADASKLMTSVLFRVRPLDPVVVIGATALLASVALLATLMPGRRATSVEPRSVFD